MRAVSLALCSLLFSVPIEYSSLEGHSQRNRGLGSAVTLSIDGGDNFCDSSQPRAVARDRYIVRNNTIQSFGDGLEVYTASGLQRVVLATNSEKTADK